MATIITITTITTISASILPPLSPRHRYACPKSWVQREIIVELKVTPRNDNPITEYLLCNVLFGCEGKEF
jgi:hypothetical protein